MDLIASKCRDGYTPSSPLTNFQVGMLSMMHGRLDGRQPAEDAALQGGRDDSVESSWSSFLGKYWGRPEDCPFRMPGQRLMVQILDA